MQCLSGLRFSESGSHELSIPGRKGMSFCCSFLSIVSVAAVAASASWSLAAPVTPVRSGGCLCS